MAEARLVVKTYEESRLEFFKEQLAAAHRRLDWSVKHNPDCYDNEEKGEVVSFYEWAVKMAENPDSLRPKGRWELQVKSFYMDNFDESIELAVYITASCSECGENHPKPHSSGQVYSHYIYAPEDADDDFRFDQDEEKAKLLNEFVRMLNSGEMRLANYCPNCGADMRCMGDD